MICFTGSNNVNKFHLFCIYIYTRVALFNCAIQVHALSIIEQSTAISPQVFWSSLTVSVYPFLDLAREGFLEVLRPWKG